MVDLNPLRRLTEELAKEIAYEEVGPRLRLLELILDNIDTLALIVSSKHKILFINKSLENYLKELGVKVKRGDVWYKSIWNLTSPPKESELIKSFEKRQVSTEEISSPLTGKSYIVSCIPLIYNGISGYIFLLNEKRK